MTSSSASSRPVPAPSTTCRAWPMRSGRSTGSTRRSQAGERIAIWGDYDADGMTAIVVWVTALRRVGADPIRYVPSRLAEGYGLSEPGLRDLASRGVTLVITCDCGVSNVAEVDLAREIGLDVVITDHHLPGAVLPRAAAVVDPHRPDCAYPDPDLTGAGLSYKLAAALLERHGVAADGLAAVAAIGTVADLAPMTGESRAIVRLGLEELATTTHAGLRALLSRGCDVPAQPTARDLAFGVVPRVNAAGRIADAELAITLMLEEDPIRAEQLAVELEAVHERRRELTKEAVDAARLLVAAERGSGPLLVRDDALGAGARRPRRRSPRGQPRSPGRGGDARRGRGSRLGSCADRLSCGGSARGLRRAPDEARRACGGRRIQPPARVVGGLFGRLRGTAQTVSRGRGCRGGATGPGRRGSRAAGSLPRLDAGRRARASRAVRAGTRRAGPGGHRHGAHRGSTRRRDGAACRAADASGPRDLRRDRLRARAGTAAPGAGRRGRPRGHARARRLRRDASSAASRASTSRTDRRAR